MKRISLIIITLLSSLLLSGAAIQRVAYADSADEVCAGITQAGDTPCDSSTGGGSINKIIASTINILSIIAGVAGVIMLILGAMRYITSGGDSNAVGAAKKTIMYALIGLVVAALSQVIVRFVLLKATH